MVLSWVKKWFGRSKAHEKAVESSVEEVRGDGRDLPESFGYKTSWLCLKTEDAAAVMGELNLINVRRVSWREGTIRRDLDVCFVTPAVDGWTLVTGFGMVPEVNDPAMLEVMKRLSGRFGHVYYFGSHRVSSYYAWVAAHKGEVTRAFGVGDSQKLVNVGAPTQRELSLGYSEAGEDELSLWADEGFVLALAKAWSFDPMSLDGRQEPEGPGWLCRVKR